MNSLPDSIEIVSNLEYHYDTTEIKLEPSNSPFDILNTAFMDGGMSLKLKVIEK